MVSEHAQTEGFTMCIDTQTRTWKLSYISINILAANYGEGKRHQDTLSLCVFSQIKATGKSGRTVPTQKAFSKGQKMSRAPGSLWELRFGAAQTVQCAEKLGHGVCHTSKVRGLWVDERKRKSRAPE